MAQRKYYKASRDYWWNVDFLHLMVKRWNLPENVNLLDVGAGQGHWSRLLADVLERPRITCLDNDLVALRVARDAAEARSVPSPAHLSVVRASAEAIPFANDAFDLVTCQTVLMHVQHPEKVLDEMVRVAKPGGLIVCVEPNDLANCAILSPVFFQEEPDALVRHFEFWLAYGRGRIALGLGDVSVGERLPALFSLAGLRNVSVHISDKALMLYPPYDSPEQQARLHEERAALNQAKDIWQGIWDDNELKECVLSGGGSYELFCKYSSDVQRRLGRLSEEMAEPTYAKAGGRLMYIVSGSKPF